MCIEKPKYIHLVYKPINNPTIKITYRILAFNDKVPQNTKRWPPVLIPKLSMRIHKRP